MLPAFLEKHPDLRLTLSLDDRVVDMIEGGFDLSIRVRSSLPDSSLVARRLGRVQQCLFASPDYLETAPALSQPDDIKAHPIIGFLLADHTSEWSLLGRAGRIPFPSSPMSRWGAASCCVIC